MKVCLINPPQSELFQPRAYIPLGLAYIGAMLQKSEINVNLLNLADAKQPFYIQFPKADYYLITCTTATLHSVKELVPRLKSKGVVLVGGSHPSVCPQETYMATNADAVVTGEAEYLVKEIVTGKIEPRPIMDAGYIKDLDALPFPARNLFSSTDIVDTTGIHGCDIGVRATTIISSRGCPYNCAFCCRNHPMFSVFRFRSAENVKEELEYLKAQYNIEHVRFVDDCFTVYKRGLIKLCQEIKELNLTWVCITRADRIDSEMLTAMKMAGCLEAHVGVETGSNQLLKLMNKNETAEDCLRAIKEIKKHGIRVKVYLMYGYPGETEEDRQQTIDLMKKAKPDKFTLSRFTPLPGSEIRKKILNEKGRTWFYPDENLGWREFREKIEESIK